MRIYVSLIAAAALAFVIAAQDRNTGDLGKKRDTAEENMTAIQKEINKVNKERTTVKKDIRSVDRDLTRVNRQLDNTTDELDNSIERRDKLEAELSLATQIMDDRKEMVESRLRQIYQQSEHVIRER